MTRPDFIALQKSINDGGFLGLSDEDALQLIYKAFPAEIRRLKDVPKAAESGKREPGLYPSQVLFREDFEEVNRTLVGVLALRWILAGDYERFAKYQPDTVKLLRESFNKLRDFFTTHLQQTGNVISLLVATVVNDLGKDPNLASEITQLNTEEPNHDMVVYEAALKGKIPCIEWLEDQQRRDVMLGLECGSKLNIAQLAQAENVPGSLRSLEIMKGNGNAFALKYMEQYLDVAGAAGHINPSCAKAMIEPVFQAYYGTYDALLNIITNGFSLRAGYDQVLKNRGTMLQGKGFRQLDVGKPSERALLRLLLMGRTDSKEKAEYFDQAFNLLEDNVREQLVNGLNVDGYEDGKAILPYYMPALFAEGLKDPKRGEVEALGALMRFLARVVWETKSEPKKKTGEVEEKSLIFAKEVIIGADFKNDPTVLDRVEIPVGGSRCV
ncbi:MAG: hypothetical protein M1840_009077 [Geoglossum simile]|nr:MAG: hypothetical protein M1840_009077 [Geoglossum simile]